MSRLTSRVVSPLLVAAVVAGCASGPAVAGPGTPAPEFRALRYPPLPAGIQEVSGTMLAEHGGAEYAVAHVRRGDEEFLWLERLVSRDAAGRPTWEVVDALHLPARPEGYRLALGTCGRGVPAGQPESGLVAYVKGDADDRHWRDVSAAWQADPAAGTLAAVPREGVSCVNEGYGL